MPHFTEWAIADNQVMGNRTSDRGYLVDLDANYCFESVRAGDRDRYLMLLFAPTPQRGDLAALAAYNLELARIRDQVTEPTLGLIRFQWWRDALGEIAEGREPRRHQVVLALADVVRRHGLNPELLLAMIDAREPDLEPIAAPTYAQFAQM